MEPTRQLPDRPNLEHLRGQARDYQREHPGVKRADALFAIARSYGFESWPQLKDYVLARQSNGLARDRFVSATLGGRLDDALAVLALAPDLLSHASVACLLGDWRRLETLDANAPLEPNGWPPLLYVCESRFWRRDKFKQALLETAKALLDRGANPNGCYQETGEHVWRRSVLYAAAGVLNDPDLTKMLLEAGADPNDNESLYHAAEHRDHACMRLLLQHGGRVPGTNSLFRMLDFEDPEGARLLAAHYRPIDASFQMSIHHAINRGRSGVVVRALLDEGVDPSAAAHGMTPYARARILGNSSAAEAIASAGGDTTLSEVEANLAGDPPTGETIPPTYYGLLPMAAVTGNYDSVARLLAAGVPANTFGEGKVGALHQAGWIGSVPIVRLLIGAGASVDLRDGLYQGTPLNWTLIARQMNAHPEGDHAGCADALLTAGYRPDNLDDLKAWTEDAPEVRKVLVRHGVL